MGTFRPRVLRKALAVGPREAFPAPPPLVEEVPQDEDADDEEMDTFRGALTPPGDGVDFTRPTKRKVVKAVTVKRVMGKGVTGRGNRFSLVAKAQTLSMRELTRLQEDLVELSNSRQEYDENPAVELSAYEISATEVEQSASLV